MHAQDGLAHVEHALPGRDVRFVAQALDQPFHLVDGTPQQHGTGLWVEAAEGRVGQQDLTIQIEHQQAFRQGVEGHAHALGNGFGGVQVLQHPPQVQVEGDEADSAQGGHQLHRGLHQPAGGRLGPG